LDRRADSAFLNVDEPDEVIARALEAGAIGSLEDIKDYFCGAEYISLSSGNASLGTRARQVAGPPGAAALVLQ